jgi:hypothetical protein
VRTLPASSEGSDGVKADWPARPVRRLLGAPTLLALVASGAALSVVLDIPPGPVRLPVPKPLPGACSVPGTLTEAHDVLGRLLTPGLLAEFRGASEADVATYNRTIGIWLRNSWGLWNGGPLRDHLRRLGLRHADDMSALVLVTFWRHLNDRPLRTEDEVRRLRAADEAEVSRFQPECRCHYYGGCTSTRLADPTPGPARAFVVSGCCCGEKPQVAEARPVVDSETGEVYVFPDQFVLDDRACGPPFEPVS